VRFLKIERAIFVLEAGLLGGKEMHSAKQRLDKAGQQFEKLGR
jgi:hypothetical protein